MPSASEPTSEQLGERQSSIPHHRRADDAEDRTISESSFDRRHKTTAVALGRVFREARHSLRASQEEVAHAAGLAVPTYSALERGETATGRTANPTMDTVLRAVYALGLEPPTFSRRAVTEVDLPLNTDVLD
ncbi:helix-turn-helix domain-containing protein [Microbacterium aquimaris]|uniref:helix-turn-helix domain-containing protein n=1 Tax=Microbacterium aquimaris TaxID=459816 RepID=UPI0039063BC6